MTRRPKRFLASLVCLLFAPAVAPAQEDLKTLPDFKVDLVLKADKDKNGSWISLGKDNKGRLLLGGQRNQPVTRLTLGADGKVAKEEVLKLPVSEVMGVLYAYDSLYLNASDGKKFALFRLQDKDGDDQYETVEMLREWKGGAGEHGAHGIVLGKDGLLYTVCGNFVDVPTDVLPSSPHRNYADDTVLPRTEDGNGFGAGRKPPGGYVLRMDKDGKNAELFAAGQRNTYDVGFDADGELFGFDSDMEWDWGAPWYRPTRAYHIPSGADHGFREGTAKWPEYYPDSLPAAVNIGIGSPTGVAFGTGAKFPVKYQKAFYILDWTYGRVIAVHLTPGGAGYTGTYENFVAPKGLVEKGGKKSPNNVTDVVIGDDGALYFTTGGRGTQGNLYRVTYTGSESTAAAPTAAPRPEQATLAKLAAFQREENPAAVAAAWPLLGSDDRTTRYVARIAIERQPVASWKAKALAETNGQAALTALLALARLGDKATQPEVLAALAKLPIDKFDERGKLEAIRVLEVSIARHGKTDGEGTKALTAALSAMYPAASGPLNRELSQTLIALDAPDAVAKTVKLLGESKVQEEQVGYALALKSAKTGWTPELRKAYFTWWTQDRKGLGHPPEVLKWFDEAGRPFADGSSFANFIGKMHADAQKGLTPDESTALADVLKAYTPPGAKPAKPSAAAKPRKFVQKWEMKDLEPELAATAKGRNFNRGKEAFAAAQCMLCHKFGNEGGGIGPDITSVATRFNRRDILESIVDPNKVISEQFQSTNVKTKDGDLVIGRVVEDKPDALVVVVDMLKPDERTTIKKANIASVSPSKLSAMPEGLINVLTKDEVFDMLAYVESAGNKDHPAFKK